MRIEVIPVDDGATSSVCAIIGDAIYEDPKNADVPTMKAQIAADAYEQDKPDTLTVTGSWNLVS